MRWQEAKKLLAWAQGYHHMLTAHGLAQALSCEGTPDAIVPRRLRRSLTSFRHQTQEVRARQAFKYLQTRTREREGVR